MAHGAATRLMAGEERMNEGLEEPHEDAAVSLAVTIPPHPEIRYVSER